MAKYRHTVGVGRQYRKNFQPWLMKTIDIDTFSGVSAYVILNPLSHTAPVEREAWRFLAAPRAARLNVIPRFKTYQVRLNLVRQSALGS